MIVLWRAVVVWLAMLVVAVASAVAREGLLTPRVGAQASHVVGTLVVVTVFLVLIRSTVGWVVPGLQPRALWTLGFAWMLATVAFEFTFGRLVMGHPWSRLLADYNLLAGRIWVLVLLAILVGPWLMGRTGPVE